MLPVLGIPGDLQKEFSEEQLWFVEPTPKEIAAGLERIYQNPIESNQRSENLQTTASQNSWQAVADMYLETIQEITDKS
jgi:glycosyltransferase involved in cell wall biosynthesis